MRSLARNFRGQLFKLSPIEKMLGDTTLEK